jgi:MarR family transcriptional regulator, 2-MHQ and catechol-resistance regulon repressor
VASCPSEDRTPVPGTDDPAIATFGRLVEVVRQLGVEFHGSIAAATGLPAAHFEVLLRLGRSPGDQLRMSELASQLGVTSGGATRLVDRVAAGGLVERRACVDDRRVHHVRLTEDGRQQLERALAVHREDLARELTSRLDPDTRAQLDRILDVLRDTDRQACAG